MPTVSTTHTPRQTGPCHTGPAGDPLAILPGASMLHAWGEFNRLALATMPTAGLIALSPFFWAPPLWIGMLMSGGKS